MTTNSQRFLPLGVGVLVLALGLFWQTIVVAVVGVVLIGVGLVKLLRGGTA